MPPVPFERFRPLMKRPDRLRIRAIEHPPTVATHINEADLPQDAQVLRNRRLLHPQRIHNLPDRPLVQRKIVQNLPPPRLRHGIEGIRSCRGSCHVPLHYIPIWEYVKHFFAPTAAFHKPMWMLSSARYSNFFPLPYGGGAFPPAGGSGS